MIEIKKPRIECIETPGGQFYGKYIIEPLERGYGTTLGNLFAGYFSLLSPALPAPASR